MNEPKNGRSNGRRPAPTGRLLVRAVYAGLGHAEGGEKHGPCVLLSALTTDGGRPLAGNALCPLTPAVARLGLREGDAVELHARVVKAASGGSRKRGGTGAAYRLVYPRNVRKLAAEGAVRS